MTATILGGAALSAGSAIANSIAQNKIDKARQNAINQQNQAQDALNARVDAANADALSHYSNFAGSTAGEQSRLGSLYGNGLIGTAGSSAPTTIAPTSSDIVSTEDAKQSAAKLGFAQQQGGALAAQSAVGDALGNANVAQAHDAATVGMLNGFKQGEASVLPYQLDAANQKGAGLKTLGDLFGAGGRIAVGYGLQNAFAPVTATPAASVMLPGRHI